MGFFILQNIFFFSLFPIHLSIKSFLLPKLWLKCPTFFIAGLGPIVFFFDGLLDQMSSLVASWSWLDAAFFWLTEFFSFTDLPIYLMTEAFLLSSLPQYHWLLFHHIAEEIQISSFLGIIFAYDALVVVLLLLVWLVMSSTFSSFFFILLVYYLKYPAATLFVLLHCSGR